MIFHGKNMIPAIPSLRNRFFLVLGLISVATLLAMGWAVRYQVTPELLKNEDEFANRVLDRAERSIAHELGHLSLMAEDWARRGNAYDFAREEQHRDIDSRLHEETLVALDLQLVAFFAEDGQPQWVSGFNPESGVFSSCPGLAAECHWAVGTVAMLQRTLQGSLPEQTHGWLVENPEPAMLSLSPIHNNHEENAGGWLAMVRPMSKQWFSQFRESTGLDIDITRVAQSQAPFGDRLVRLSDDVMIAQRPMVGLSFEQPLVIEAKLSRQRFQASLETFHYALYWSVGGLIVVYLVMLLLLEYRVLWPLRRFKTVTKYLRHDENTTMPSSLTNRHDEIGTLAREFQRLLTHQQHQTATLTELSQHDPLTKLANRRLLDEHLVRTLDKARRAQTPVTLMMLDIDYFKTYNDYFGHSAGDEALITLADTMAQHFKRPKQLVARIGGEEFVVVLPGLAGERAVTLAEKLRSAIEKLALRHPTSPISKHVTISIGIAVSRPEQPREATELMHAADMALYRAKHAGRNTVQFEPSVLDEE